MREQLRNRAVLLVAILAVALALALLGAYTWNQTAPTRCPKAGACGAGETHRVHPLRARIEWAAAVVLVVGAASLAVTGRPRRRG
jgi:integral membrane sensor domain MASE1